MSEYRATCLHEDASGEQCGLEFSVEYRVWPGRPATREDPADPDEVEFITTACPAGHEMNLDEMEEEIGRHHEEEYNGPDGPEEDY